MIRGRYVGYCASGRAEHVRTSPLVSAPYARIASHLPFLTRLASVRARQPSHAGMVDKTKKRPPQAQAGDRPQQPADVIACRSAQLSSAQHMQCRASSPLQPAPIHTVVGHGVADQRFDGLAPLEQSPFTFAERLVFASVDHLHAGVVGIHAPVAQVLDDLLGQVALGTKSSA